MSAVNHVSIINPSHSQTPNANLILLDSSGNISRTRRQKAAGFSRMVLLIGEDAYYRHKPFASGAQKTCSFASCLDNPSRPTLAILKTKDLPPVSLAPGEESPIAIAIREVDVINKLRTFGVTSGIPEVLAHFRFISGKPHQLRRHVMVQPAYGTTLSEVALPESDEKDRVCYRLLKILDSIHTAEYLHSDIKPDNVLIDASVGAQSTTFIDFGSAHPLAKLGTSSSPFSAPEVLDGFTSTASDVFSLGLTFAAFYHPEVYRTFISKQAVKIFRLPQRQNLFKSALQDAGLSHDPTILKMLETEPSKRASIRELLEQFNP